MKRRLIVILYFLFLTISSFAQFEINPDNRDEYIEAAKQLFNENKWEEGKKTVDVGLEKYPKDSDLKELNGRYYLEKRDYEKARYELKKAIEYNHKNLSAKQTLVTVEMATERYSSAIAYINEILEAIPYDKTLWLKKAEAFRAQGNIVESNRLLKRIHHIYPEDKVLKSNLLDYLYEEYSGIKETASVDEVAELAIFIINEDPQNEDVYLGLINKYLQAGDFENALTYAEKAVYDMPKNITVIKKRNSILAHLNRYQEILSSLKELMAQNGTTVPLQQEYNYYMEEAARHSEKSDHYYNYQMLFQKNPKDKAYFNKVYTTALSRKLFDDASEAIKLARRAEGDTKDLLLKELYLYEQMGNQSKIKQLTYRINEQYPEDEDIKYQKCVLYYKEAKDLMADRMFQKAMPFLIYIEENGDEELVNFSLNSQYSCLVELKDLDKAIVVIDKLIASEPQEEEWRFKKSSLLGNRKDYLEALQEYEYGLQLIETKGDYKLLRLAGYDEQATMYIKALMDAYRFEEAIELIDHCLDVYPESEAALRYGYNISYQMKDVEKMKKYLSLGIEQYPEDIFYLLKMAEAHISTEDYELASAILLPLLEKHPYHTGAIASYSLLQFYKAKQLIKQNDVEEGMKLLDDALLYDADNSDVKYMKGVAFEKLHMTDSAAYYQSFYDPSLRELKDYERHMKYLNFVKKKHEVTFFSDLYRPSDLDIITAVSGVEYLQMGRKDTYAGRFFYSGRDNGKGVMVQAEWSHVFNKKFYSMLNASVGDKAFPRFTANVAAYYTFLPSWEAELTLGFRNLSDTLSNQMFNQQVGVSKEFSFARFTAKFNSVILDKSWHYNISGQGRFYIRDHRNYVTAMGGLGSAPDIEVIDAELYRSFDVTNVMVGLGGHFILSEMCSIDATALWYNYKFENTLYKNMYSLQLKLNIRF